MEEKNALILHGTDGSSNIHWFQWLKIELEKRGYTVWVPDLPHAELPNLTGYNDFIFPKWKFNNSSIIIGHSSGAVAILGILQDLPEDVVIEKAILVAGFTDDLGWEKLKELFVKAFDWDKIKKHAKKFVLIHSDDDPYVKLSHGKFLKEKLRGKLTVMKDQGHFSTDTAGEKYKEFPELLKYIK